VVGDLWPVQQHYNMALGEAQLRETSRPSKGGSGTAPKGAREGPASLYTAERRDLFKSTSPRTLRNNVISKKTR
jgi:hypothetical protein